MQVNRAVHVRLTLASLATRPSLVPHPCARNLRANPRNEAKIWLMSKVTLRFAFGSEISLRLYKSRPDHDARACQLDLWQRQYFVSPAPRAAYVSVLFIRLEEKFRRLHVVKFHGSQPMNSHFFRTPPLFAVQLAPLAQ